MPSEVQTSIQTLDQVLAFMAPFAGGSVPSEEDQEYTDWISWIQNKQEEYARRAFWRRCLTREVITLTEGFTTVLPDRFNKPNALYMLIVDEIDWNEVGNSDKQNIFIEMINDNYSADFGSWQMRFELTVPADTEAIMWYFSNPPKPTSGSDKLLLPGDMIGFAALAEYARQANQEGSQDKFEEDAENRFQEYLSLEVIPDKSDLLTHSQEQVVRKDYLQTAKSFYTTRVGRNRT